MDKFYFKEKLDRSWLVQRLNAPQVFHEKLGIQDNPFSFGGGLKNGGISKEGMDAIRNIFSFDYMGSSEFEWGIVPSCLSFLIENREKIITGSLVIKEGKPTVYYLCHKAHAKDIQEHIKTLAAGNYRSKEFINLDIHFQKEPPKWGLETVGWLDCSNGFMFFVDKDMWEKTLQLLGINETPSK
jgi:hypothetical protein